jgi:hemin uptake protein HemP
MLAAHDSRPRETSASSAETALPPTTRRVRSEDQLEGRREVLIRHGKECYRLTHTRSGKLILTK